MPLLGVPFPTRRMRGIFLASSPYGIAAALDFYASSAHVSKPVSSFFTSKQRNRCARSNFGSVKMNKKIIMNMYAKGELQKQQNHSNDQRHQGQISYAMIIQTYRWAASHLYQGQISHFMTTTEGQRGQAQMIIKAFLWRVKKREYSLASRTYTA